MDFLQYVIYLLDNNYLQPGDFFLLNNARIHGGDATWDLIEGLLSSQQIQLIWLPKYSPELNPVELYWRFLKTKLRNLPTIKAYMQLITYIIDITATIPLDYICNWIHQCMTIWQSSDNKRKF